MTTPNKKRFSLAMLALTALMVAGIYSCNSNPPAEEKKAETPTVTAPDSSTKAPVDSTAAAKSKVDTGDKGGQTPPPPPPKTN